MYDGHSNRPQRPPPVPQNQVDPNYLFMHNLNNNNNNMFYQNPNFQLPFSYPQPNPAFPFFPNPGYINNFIPPFPPQTGLQKSVVAPIAAPANPPPKPNVPIQHKAAEKSSNQAAGESSSSKFMIPKAKFSIPHPPPKPNTTSHKPLDKIEKAVVKARGKLIAAGENISAFNLSVVVAKKLKADSWDALGCQMKNVPSLNRIMTLERQVDSFINCFVGVRRITSLYELEVSICKNVRVKQFDDLELGPLVRHPLAVDYFSLNPELKIVHKITSDDIISYLWLYMNTGNRKEVVADQFLDFIAKKRSLTGRDELGVRIQSLGLHVGTIREARRLEDGALNKFLEGNLIQKSNKNSKKRPLFSKHKQQTDKRFSAISQRMKSFSSINEEFDSKHIYFVSSSSEENEDNKDASKLTSQSAKSCDQVSSCPYPSLNEERVRLGLKCEMPSTSGYSFTYDEKSPPKKKRKRETASPDPEPSKLATAADDETGNGDLQFADQEGFSLSNSSMGTFITTWKEACREQTVHEVFDRMLQFYNLTSRQRKRMKSVFLTFPCLGLLNVAITSIKHGMWDSIYDTLFAIGNHGLTDLVTDNSPKYESIDVEPSAKNKCIADLRQNASIEDIIRKITAYFESGIELSSNGKSHLDRQLLILGKLSSCEGWLAGQFAVKEFKTLGHGDFITFLQNNISKLPSALVNILVGYIHESSPFRVCILENQLSVLLSQAWDSSWEDEAITKQKITLLLTRQFPSINFSIVENGPTEDFFKNLRDRQSSAIAKCLFFSATLFETSDYGNSSARNASDLYDITGSKTEFGPSARRLGRVSFDDAMKVLLRAPMLSDLHVWSHWDLVFAPSLGPLVGWLLNDVNSKELLCLLTKEGKVIRVNPSATLESYLEASLQGAPFRTAVELISLFSLYGGQRHLPVSILENHTHQAFQVIIKNSGESMGVHDTKSYYTDRAITVASKFFLDCLGYFPSEFRNFAAEILLFGLRSIVKDAPSSILCECKDIEQCIMLHDVGLALGIVEWIDDYNTLRSTSNDPLNPSSISCLLPPKSKLATSSSYGHSASNKVSSSKSDIQISVETDRHANISNNKMEDDDSMQNASEQYQHKDASFIIESIRREEFGLDTDVSETHSSMLKKQHARLGRALHCLSQELYSQDSHFLLELVQNADDNVYLEKTEPTLTFILRETGIIVLNNERGFSSHNIKALCDIGNSTKKGSGAGYIGQKGIGFKSVFRVTDAPEIHSNGFHVKFDISEGQIGFVLPTEVPACSIDLFGEMALEDGDKSSASCWNTCIVLPFSKKILERAAVNSIISMFSDLHPSLLLFLHRLRCIKFRNLLDDSLVVMRKKHVGDGIIKVSHGSETMTWLAVSRTLQADGIRPDVKTTEIALAFTLGELEDGVYAAHLEQQPVFAFLPLRAYGLKFILQGDFVLPSSREEVDGSSPWNQWLLSEFPDLFISAESSFCDIPCFQTNKGKAVSAYMSFVPLIGEVHGFFSCLPRLIISQLRMSNCLLLEDDSDRWVPPCKAIRRWNERARALLPDSILRDRLGLGLLDKNIILSDPLASALGIEEYGPKVLLKVLSSLSLEEHGLRSMGIAWLQSWLNELYVLSFHSSGHGSVLETEIIDNLRKIPFIPLSDGRTYVSVNEGTVWLHSEASISGFDSEHGSRIFPNLYANLRMVNPDLLVSTAKDCEDTSLAGNITRVLYSIGVQRLSEHEIIKVHILPSLSKETTTNRDKSLMTEYLSFVMLHLQSGCLDCRTEKSYILSDLCNKAFISTNYGYKRLFEVPIHFGKECGNPINVNKLIDGIDFEWHEVDAAYLTCPSTKSVSSVLTDWRNFFQEVGVTDFIDVVQREKSIADISHSFKRLFSDGEIVSLDSIATDWESDEMSKLLSLLSLKGDVKRCRYMLEVVDNLWDSSYADKTVGFCNSKSSADSKPFKSSFMHSICDVAWVASSMDDGLHYPKDLFHDCDSVRAVFGASAPYAVPKVKNEKLLCDIGFKTQVTLDDIFSILQVWRRSGTPFHASIAQMTRFYTLIWNELSTWRSKVLTDLCSGPYIFVPYARVLRHEDVIPGIFVSSEDVYWHDSTGSIEQIQMITPTSSECMDVTSGPSPNILSIVYPGLHDFFVNECKVDETPSFRSYLQVLLQLSSVGLPSNSAKAVFQVFLKWADGMKSQLLSSDDIDYLRESLRNKETTILPTVQDKWASLHTSFGLVCWCDDESLKEEFKHSDNVDFIYFGVLNNDDKELLREKVSVILKALGIPSISEVVTREAIYDGTQDCSFKASLVNWALPYAQRYIYNIHPLRYSQLKQTDFGNLNNLQVSVVDSLSSRNVIKRGDIASKKRFECNSLLQGNILFTRAESDSHSVFMELSRLFFNGTPELNLANFLHMITTMVQSGSSEEQLEFFISNSQNLPKLADKDDSVWALSSISNKEEDPSKSKRKRGSALNWPPASWKNMNFAHTNGYREEEAAPATKQKSNKIPPQEKFEANCWTIENASILPEDTEALEDPVADSTMLDVEVEAAAAAAANVYGDPEQDTSKFSRRDQVNTGNPNPQQAMLTGRLGETIASNYFKNMMGNAVVKWVNEFNETGLPYDIMIEEQGKAREYIEVKATTSARKDWFIISTREWQFAAEMGDSYSIAHVALLGSNKAKITRFRNPLKLCQQGQLQLLVMMPKEQREFALVER